MIKQPAWPAGLRWCKAWLLRRVMLSHIAGASLENALDIYRQAALRGWSCTFAYWSGSADTPANIARRHADALDAIARQRLACYISVKAPSLNYDFGRIRALLEQAEPSGVRIHFDAMDPASADPTFALIERCLAYHRNIGCTLPARWQRSLDDAQRLIEMQIPVRVVKGQWADPHNARVDIRQSYLTIIHRLAGRAAHVAVATHDRSLARDALAILCSTGTRCEMEQLSSLPQNCARLAKSLAVPFRIYVPFGDPSLPYDIGHMKTRPAILAWILRDALAGYHRDLSR